MSQLLHQCCSAIGFTFISRTQRMTGRLLQQHACFLLAKLKTFCSFDKVIVVAYRTMYKKDSDAARRIHQKDVFEKQKALVLTAERVLLSTIRFNFNVQHPYKSLLNAFKKFLITQKEVRQYAWNYINGSLETTLCLQYKPHYIAAGAIFLAAKIHNVKLPSERGYVWWTEFDVTPQLLNVAIHDMAELLGFKRSSAVTKTVEKPIQQKPFAAKYDASSPESCVLSSNSSQDVGGTAVGSNLEDSITRGSTNYMDPLIVQTHQLIPDNPIRGFEYLHRSGKGPEPERVDSRPGEGMKRRKREREIMITESNKGSWID